MASRGLTWEQSMATENETDVRPYAHRSTEWVEGAYYAARLATRIVSLRGHARECVEAHAFGYLDELKARGVELVGAEADRA